MITVLLLGASVAGLIGFRIGPLTTAQSFRTTPPSVAAQYVAQFAELVGKHRVPAPRSARDRANARWVTSDDADALIDAM